MRVFVHPNGLCESDSVGPGTRVWAFAHVQDGAVVGADCNIGDGAFVEKGAVVGDRCAIKNGVCVWARVTLEDDVFAGPNVAFTNDLVPRMGEYKTAPEDWTPTLVRSFACLGANSTIVCGVTVGRHALVAAGAVVTKDVLDHAVVAGNPARQRGWICACGERLPGAGTCPRCARRFLEEATGLVEQG